MQRPIGSEKIRRAYAFLAAAEADGRAFTVEELAQASGWSRSTTRAYLSKKLPQLVRKADGAYECAGVRRIAEDPFCRMFSQTTALASEPDRPLLPPKVEGLVKKSRDAALAAVQHYNNPTAASPSGNYLMLMVVAYTALFHAILERNGVDYVERDDAGQPKTARGEPLLWDAQRSAKHYAKEYLNAPSSAMVHNLDLLVPLRHKIEHRFLPALDPAQANGGNEPLEAEALRAAGPRQAQVVVNDSDAWLWPAQALRRLR